MQRRNFLVSAIGAALLAGAITTAHAADIKQPNVSYDPTRELYQEYNAAFAKYWKAQSGDNVTISQSHGGAGARAYRGNCRPLCAQPGAHGCAQGWLYNIQPLGVVPARGGTVRGALFDRED
jgi:hypothetical protein